jgi:hypothetical protein
VVCIKKQPYIYYVRLTFKNRHFFRYLTCLLDRGHITPPGAFLLGKIIFEKIEYLPVAIEYHESVKGLEVGVQSHGLKTPFSE